MATNLTPHFTLEEMTVTKTGLSNIPNDEQTNELLKLCRDILEPLREELSCRYGHRDVSGWPEYIPLIVDSAFRSPAVNKAVGGVPSSQHLLGQAADIRSIKLDANSIYSTVHKLVFDGHLTIGQCILYTKSHFVHVSLPTSKHINDFIVLNK